MKSLEGIRVLDLSIWRPGPYATQLLTEMGAEVLKVEPPGGDPMRVFPDLFASLNAGKRSVALDLHSAEDRARALELASGADVLVEGFRPGVIARLGLSWEVVHEANPSLVFCSISGFGQYGPLAAYPGHDLNYQAWAGVLAPDGGPPVECAVPIADLAGGAYAALAICAACVGSRAGRGGERIDVSMTDVLATWTGPFNGTAMAGEHEPLGGLPSYGTFGTAEGKWIALGVIDEDHFWKPLCDALGLEDLRDLEVHERVARTAEIRDRLMTAIGARRRDDLVAEVGHLSALSPVLDRDEMLATPHLRQRAVVVEGADGRPAMGHPVRFMMGAAGPSGHAPALDAHRGEGFSPRPA
ncbi:MAG: CaiB/BaiF CoA transferase family protein [Acidimicrobiales bacterium]